MTIERTFSIIKPDATERNLTGKINAILEDAGLRIIAQKRIHLTKELAKKFYAVHKGKFFFENLIKTITSAPVVVQVLEGKDAILKNREIMGKTNKDEAAEGTIRKLYALNVTENCVHGSDSVENADKEIRFFFSDMEIVG